MTDMTEVKRACDELESAIDACAKACEAAGAYMPGFATRLRVIADYYADRFPDDTNGGAS